MYNNSSISIAKQQVKLIGTLESGSKSLSSRRDSAFLEPAQSFNGFKEENWLHKQAILFTGSIMH